eukprot:760593-Hanusia_phi.AAC.1
MPGAQGVFPLQNRCSIGGGMRVQVSKTDQRPTGGTVQNMMAFTGTTTMMPKTMIGRCCGGVNEDDDDDDDEDEDEDEDEDDEDGDDDDDDEDDEDDDDDDVMMM